MACSSISLGKGENCFLYSLQYKQYNIEDRFEYMYVYLEWFQENRWLFEHHMYAQLRNAVDTYIYNYMTQALFFNGG